MYTPPHFCVDDHEAMFGLIAARPLGLLISAGPGGLMANPIPFLIGRDGDSAWLEAHLARPNPQWREIEAAPEILVVFNDVDAYATPSWYPAKAEHGKVVPTWNYATVQVRGQARTHHEADWLHRHVNALTDRHEAARAQPWSVDDAPPSHIAAMARGIVGVSIAIGSMEGKWRLSQNRPEADRAGVADGLAAEGGSAAAMAAMVAAFGPGPRS